jgi:hypothetical protein
MQQGDIALKAHVVSVCFMCFGGMLQVFQMDVAKVDWDVAYVTMLYMCIAKVCSQCFIYVFEYMLQVFIWMLHMFHR